jgi:hypothetical protein
MINIIKRFNTNSFSKYSYRRKLSISFNVLDLNDYIDKNRSTLKPPVSNKLMFYKNNLVLSVLTAPVID